MKEKPKSLDKKESLHSCRLEFDVMSAGPEAELHQ